MAWVDVYTNWKVGILTQLLSLQSYEVPKSALVKPWFNSIKSKKTTGPLYRTHDARVSLWYPEFLKLILICFSFTILQCLGNTSINYYIVLWYIEIIVFIFISLFCSETYLLGLKYVNNKNSCTVTKQ